MLRPAAPYVAVAIAVAAVLTSPSSKGQGKEECVAAAEEGQQHRHKGEFTRAIDRFQRCAQQSCPAVVIGDCSRFLTETEAAQPTLVLRARDSRGRDLVDVAVSIDGTVVVSRLDGRAIPIDPGEHRIVFSAEGLESVERRFVAVEGEKRRVVAVDFEATEEPVSPRSTEPIRVSEPRVESSSGPPLATWVLGGVGLAALAGTTYFGLSAASERADLEDTCGLTRTCTQDQVDGFRRKAVVADVLLGIGAVSLGAAVVLWATDDGRPRTEAGLIVRPAGGAVAGVRHSF